MTKARKVAWIIVALLAAAAIGGGIFYHLRQNTPEKLLSRARLAVQAGYFDKAEDLVDSYIGVEPNDWKGHFLKAQIFIKQGKYEQARPPLEQTRRLKGADDPTLTVAIAGTYSNAAMARAAAPSKAGAAGKIEAMKAAIEELADANDVLMTYQADPNHIEIRQAKAINARRKATVLRSISDLLLEEARVAEAARNPGEAEKNRSLSEFELSQSHEAMEVVIEGLLSVVVEDPSRDDAAGILLDCCLAATNPALRGQGTPSGLSLAAKALAAMNKVRETIESLNPPPPNATVTLALADFQHAAGDAEKIAAIAERLDKVIASNPNHHRAKLARAKVAMAGGDLDKVKTLAGQVAKANPADIEARLLSIQAMLCKATTAPPSRAEPAYAEAERQLYEVKSRLAPGSPFFAQANYLYAVAAEYSGKRELAMNALRVVATQAEEAREAGKAGSSSPYVPMPFVSDVERIYATRLLRQGAAEEAFICAQPYYAQYPDDPTALNLLVESALATGRRQLAANALRKAWKGDATGGSWRGMASSPAMLLVVVDGFASLAMRNDAEAVLTELLDKAAASPPKTKEDSIAVADAMIRRNRFGEAEKILTDVLGRSPRDLQAMGLLAKLYAATGRYTLAEEVCRQAVAAEPAAPRHRLSLARLLIEAGDLDEARQVLEPVVPTSASAAVMDIRIRQLKGEPIESDARALLKRGDLGRHHRPQLAALYLAAGRFEECKETCLTLLQEDKGNADLLATLAGAYRALGRSDKAIETWKEAVKTNPGNSGVYRQLLPLLIFSQSASADGAEPSSLIRMKSQEAVEVTKKAQSIMAAIPSARADLVDLAVARFYEKARLYHQAAESYGKLAADSKVTPDVRYLAQLRYARALADLNQPDKALEALDLLIKNNTGRAQTRPMADKADLLALLHRTDDAVEELKTLRQRAIQARDTESLTRAVGTYARMGKPELAIQVCRELRGLVPNDPTSYLLEANTLDTSGRSEQAIELYEQAIELQPNNFAMHDRLVRLLNRLRRPQEALEAVRRPQKLGRAGRLHGLLREGLLLTNWGLAAQAVDRFEKLAELQEELRPDHQITMASCLRRLGRNEEAAATLKKVPPHSAQYVPAQLMLAEMADGTDAKLTIARELGRVKSGSPAALRYEMSLLVDANKPDEALAALKRYQADGARPRPIPAAVRGLALVAAAQTGDPNAVGHICGQVTEVATSTGIRMGAALLAMDDPNLADIRPGPAEPSVYPTMMSLCLAGRAGDANAAAACVSHLKKLRALLASRQPPRKIPPAQLLLCGILGGDEEFTIEAADLLSSLTLRQAAKELLSAEPGKRSEEATDLLRCALAREAGLPALSRTWAMALLKARPTCQWAAMEMALAGSSQAELEQVAKTVKPIDSLIARKIQADLMMRSGRYGEAVKLYAALAAQEGNQDPTVLEDYALALEAAEKLPEALAAYRKIWEDFQTPLAANNAACLVMKLHGGDPAKLAEAAGWVEKALTRMPAPALVETAGWLAHLQGKNDKALALLRGAIGGLIDSPEAHYHLGTVESAAGNTELGNWHLSAAVDLGNDLKATGKPIPKTTAQAVELAKQALSAAAKPQRVN